jgi:hypothetical protein
MGYKGGWALPRKYNREEEENKRSLNWPARKQIKKEWKQLVNSHHLTWWGCGTM